MEVTNGEIWLAGFSPSKEELSPLRELLEKEWPVKTSYWLTKLGREINGHLQDIGAVRLKLIEQYGILAENGNKVVKEGDANWPNFLAAYDELMSQAVTISMEPVVLPSSGDITLKPLTLMNLGPFVLLEEPN